jgi:hypothetical protein
MPKIFFFFLLTTLLITAVFQPAQAQHPAKVPRIGYLSGGSLSPSPLASKPSVKVCAI